MVRSEIICKLEEHINSDKRVILYDHSDAAILHLLCDRIAERGMQNVEIWCSVEAKNGDFAFLKLITEIQMKELLDLYYLYDFSDRVTVVAESGQYGSLFNYIRNGILTPEEMLDAILYKI